MGIGAEVRAAVGRPATANGQDDGERGRVEAAEKLDRSHRALEHVQ